jgi:hypothetical protein
MLPYQPTGLGASGLYLPATRRNRFPSTFSCVAARHQHHTTCIACLIVMTSFTPHVNAKASRVAVTCQQTPADWAVSQQYKTSKHHTQNKRINIAVAAPHHPTHLSAGPGRVGCMPPALRQPPCTPQAHRSAPACGTADCTAPAGSGSVTKQQLNVGLETSI